MVAGFFHDGLWVERGMGKGEALSRVVEKKFPIFKNNRAYVQDSGETRLFFLFKN